MKKYIFTSLIALSVLSVLTANPTQDIYSPIPELEQLGIKPTDQGETILDFSRVGYQWGDKEIPDVPVVIKLSAPKDGSDAYELIQGAIDKLSARPLKERGAILLKAGKYNVSQTLNINASGIVLRGEGTDPEKGTHIHHTTTQTNTTLFKFAGKGSRKVFFPTKINITEDVPAGRFWVKVSNPKQFKVGDNVVVHATITKKLISDLKMDQLRARPGFDSTKYQWSVRRLDQKYMERVITKRNKDTLWFDNPIAIGLWEEYGRGDVAHYSYENRINECGIENMYLDCTYTDEQDENHGWIGISFNIAEHCWVRNIHGKHFGMALVYVNHYAKNVTVRNCSMSEHKSTLKGSRRYPFIITGQLSIIKDCFSKDARHAFATSGSPTNGPNVFLRCRGIDVHADIGPHMYLATGTLYDNVSTTGKINIHDRDILGPAHGWTEVNGVLWNCEASAVAVQSPWVLGYNYSIGTIATKSPGFRPERPDGIWISHQTHVTPTSLYEAQMKARKKRQPGGVFDVN